MHQYQYTSLDRIFTKISRDLGLNDLNESDIIEWAGEALEAIGAVTAYEEAVAFIEVKNHQAEVPNRMHSIIQIAKNNCFDRDIKDKKDIICPSKIIQEMPSTEDTRYVNPCNCGVEDPCTCNGTKVDFTLLDCDGKPITGYDIAYYRPYFDLQYEYYNWNTSTSYRSCYSPIRLSNNSFFNSLVCEEPNTKHPLYQSAEEEYTIIGGKILRFSFKEGSIAIAYNRQMIDEETGYPMIPDDFSYTTAITKYITLRIMERDFYAGREGSHQRVQKAEADWHWYCKQAGNKDLMPKGVDAWQNIMEQRNHILPKRGHYYSFFGKMSRDENRKWNDPDNRNRFGGYYNRY